MFTANVELNVKRTEVPSGKTAQASCGMRRAYCTPELHDVGKAGRLVQGGSGNHADNNRARQY